MPIRPFPHPFNIGIDIASLNRIRHILGRDDGHPRHLVGLARRILTRRERLQFWAKYASYDVKGDRRALAAVSRFLAGRFAAKEAAIKAFTARRLSFHDIVIRTPIFGEEMSAVILDDATPDPRPVQFEEELLAAAGRSAAFTFNNASGERRFGDPNLPKLPPKILEGQVSGLGEHVGPPVEMNVDADEGVELSGQVARLSISHDGDYATAVCLAGEEPIAGDVGGEAAARGFVNVGGGEGR